MKKTFPIFILIVLCILLSSMHYIKSHLKTDSSEATLIKSFNNSGAKVVNSEIYFWARIGTACKNFDELKLLAEKITSEMGIMKNSSYSINTAKNDSIEKLDIRGSIDGKQNINMSFRIDKKGKDSIERTVSGTIMQELTDDGLEETREGLEKTFKKYGISPKLNTCIIGNYEGKLDDGKLDNIARGILKEAEADKIEGIRNDRLISVSAYSPNITNSIRVNGKRVNLNLAIRYNSYEDKTYIWLATPVITKEY